MKGKLRCPGLRELRVPLRADIGLPAPISLIGAARALFRLPDGALRERRRSLVSVDIQERLLSDTGRVAAVDPGHPLCGGGAPSGADEHPEDGDSPSIIQGLTFGSACASRRTAGDQGSAEGDEREAPW
jgi:hypothetical protein